MKLKFAAIFFLFSILGMLGSFAQRPFITTWKPEGEVIVIPTIGLKYNYTIKIYDAKTNALLETAEVKTQNYTSRNRYNQTVRVEIHTQPDGSGFPSICFNAAEYAKLITEINQWGDVKWETMQFAFWGCCNMEGKASDVPNLEQALNLSHMFHGALLFNQSINNWDVSAVTDMSYMFSGASAFNQNLDSWNMSSVMNMEYMFNKATSFNQDVSAWDVSAVSNMQCLFAYAEAFNNGEEGNGMQKPLLWGEKTAELLNAKGLFRNTKFNQDVSSWNVGKVITMTAMFMSTPFNQNLNSCDVSSVTSMANMFHYAADYNNGDIACNDSIPMEWGEKTAKLKDVSSMFLGAKSFNQDLNSWDISSINNRSNMFVGAVAFKHDDRLPFMKKRQALPR